MGRSRVALVSWEPVINEAAGAAPGMHTQHLFYSPCRGTDYFRNTVSQYTASPAIRSSAAMRAHGHAAGPLADLGEEPVRSGGRRKGQGGSFSHNRSSQSAKAGSMPCTCGGSRFTSSGLHWSRKYRS